MKIEPSKPTALAWTSEMSDPCRRAYEDMYSIMKTINPIDESVVVLFKDKSIGYTMGVNYEANVREYVCSSQSDRWLFYLVEFAEDALHCLEDSWMRYFRKSTIALMKRHVAQSKDMYLRVRSLT